MIGAKNNQYAWHPFCLTKIDKMAANFVIHYLKT